MRISHRVVRRRLTNGTPAVPCKEFLVQAAIGRGRKQCAWAVDFQKVIIVDFERLSKAGLNFNGGIIKRLAKNVLLDQEGEYSVLSGVALDERRFLLEKITPCWVQSFMERFGIVPRKQCGKLNGEPNEAGASGEGGRISSRKDDEVV